MLTFLGIAMVITFTYLIMAKKLSPVTALVAIPIIFAVIAGFRLELGDMMMDGIKEVAPSAALLLFAILFFGILIDAGLFDPMINTITRLVQGDPAKIALGTAVIAMTAALDGDGTTTHMITISAMFALYLRIGMNPLILATISLLAVSVVSGLTPWGGPATRAIASLGLDADEFFLPIIPTMLGGMASILFIAYVLGLKERARLGVVEIKDNSNVSLGMTEMAVSATAAAEESLKRPKLRIVNLILVVTVMSLLVMGVMPVAVLFLIGFVIACVINYPNIDLQKERIQAHAGNALTVVVLVFAAGIFSGIFSGTGMVDAISNALIAIIPESAGGFFPLIVAITSMPFTFVLSNDAYYFGVLPILAEAGTAYGASAMEIARASVLGQPVHFLSPLVASTLLLTGMVKRDLGEIQKFAFKWAFLCSVFMIIVAVLTGVI
ncbi:citrate-Mg2+:H+ or citrate-Ca2+:H+ symporter, CitMHS family [Bhargavaea ginsengi]|uniref:Citrate-Mg2+:H+ or citrate-Ca2+:H+ symporter, CitMHS family n=1 Tax=Bhargavaea ginsengi TaxID=426757 RepID=A0A1H6UU23_9BACL|nr:citrate-Mg2+:H+ or citrate-Ca2+:H+ symporter, CitMHS family [Bhargavaea ginsengi]